MHLDLDISIEKLDSVLDEGDYTLHAMCPDGGCMLMASIESRADAVIRMD